MQVVYADVLIILNTYVNFALLRLASLISSANASRIRLLISALTGGVYSLIILVDGIPDAVSVLLKIAVSVLMTLIAFGYNNFHMYAKRVLSFIFVSFLFAGSMFALWIFVRPDTMLYNNATVYFQFDTMTLLIATTVCYAILRFICLIIDRKAPKGYIYDLTVYIDDKTVSCKALLDSGNTLKDYFTSLSIVTVDSTKFSFIPNDIEKIPPHLKPRYVPVNTVSGDSVMLTVKPERVRIKGINCDFETKDLLIGLSYSKIKNGDFDAVLPYETVQMREEKNHA